MRQNKLGLSIKHSACSLKLTLLKSDLFFFLVGRRDAANNKNTLGLSCSSGGTNIIIALLLKDTIKIYFH